MRIGHYKHPEPDPDPPVNNASNMELWSPAMRDFLGSRDSVCCASSAKSSAMIPINLCGPASRAGMSNYTVMLDDILIFANRLRRAI